MSDYKTTKLISNSGSIDEMGEVLNLFYKFFSSEIKQNQYETRIEVTFNKTGELYTPVTQSSLYYTVNLLYTKDEVLEAFQKRNSEFTHYLRGYKDAKSN
jgi:hypothetical protein